MSEVEALTLIADRIHALTLVLQDINIFLDGIMLVLIFRIFFKP